MLLKRKKEKEEEIAILEYVKTLPFFQQMDEIIKKEILKEFYKNFFYESKISGSTIYEKGQEPSFFYIIISGSVLILLSKFGIMPADNFEDRNTIIDVSNYKDKSHVFEEKKKEEKSFEDIFFLDRTPKVKSSNTALSRKKSYSKINGFEWMNMNLERASQQKEKEFSSSVFAKIAKVLTLKYPEYYIAETIKKNQTFGEAPIVSNGKREDVAICKENTILLCIPKNVYKGIIMLNHSKQLRETVNFFGNFQFLNTGLLLS